MRKSTVNIKHDSAGEYETEVFDVDNPKSVIICAHGNGVRRWDGEHFFHHVADHYPKHAFYLVDQNQTLEDGCALNDLSIMVSRVQSLISQAKEDHPKTPIIVMGHSMGCGIASRLDLSDVQKVIFVAPAAGNAQDSLIKRYGGDVRNGMKTTSSDGLTKYVTKEYFDSVAGVIWEDEYKKMLSKYAEVYAFESGAEEIVGEERFAHRTLPFAAYATIPDAPHNLVGSSLGLLFTELDSLI